MHTPLHAHLKPVRAADNRLFDRMIAHLGEMVEREWPELMIPTPEVRLPYWEQILGHLVAFSEQHPKLKQAIKKRHPYIANRLF